MNLAGPLSTYKRIEFGQRVLKAALARSKGSCEKCGTAFSDANPPEGDHRLEAWEGGDGSLENCQMLGAKCCHVKKTAVNTRRRKKADAQSRESHWIKRAAKKSKKKIPSRGFQRWVPPPRTNDPDT